MNGKMELCDKNGLVLLNSFFDSKELCKELFDIWNKIGNEGDYVQIKIFAQNEKLQSIEVQKQKKKRYRSPNLIPDEKTTIVRMKTINSTPYNSKPLYNYDEK